MGFRDKWVEKHKDRVNKWAKGFWAPVHKAVPECQIGLFWSPLSPIPWFGYGHGAPGATTSTKGVTDECRAAMLKKIENKQDTGSWNWGPEGITIMGTPQLTLVGTRGVAAHDVVQFVERHGTSYQPGDPPFSSGSGWQPWQREAVRQENRTPGGTGRWDELDPLFNRNNPLNSSGRTTRASGSASSSGAQRDYMPFYIAAAATIVAAFIVRRR